MTFLFDLLREKLSDKFARGLRKIMDFLIQLCRRGRQSAKYFRFREALVYFDAIRTALRNVPHPHGMVREHRLRTLLSNGLTVTVLQKGIVGKINFFTIFVPLNSLLNFN